MSSFARILIVTNGPLCRNPRVVKEATTLGRNGHAVTVLTVRNHAPSDPIDLALLCAAPFRRETVDMLPGCGPAAFARRLFVRGARVAASRLGWKTISSLGPAGSVLRRMRAFPADLIIVHNEIPHWAGSRLIGEGRRVAADIEDWHSEDLLPEERRHRPMLLLRRTEQFLLRRAVYTTTTSHALADALFARYGGVRPCVLSNSFPLQTEPRRALGDPPAFFWFSQTLGAGRGLENFLSAWSLTTQPSTVVFLGEPRPRYTEDLLRLLPASHRLRVSFRPLVPPDALPAVIAAHDIGLALEDSAIVNRDLTITNKILQYLNAGLAVVATSTTGQREVIRATPDCGLLLSPDLKVQAAQLDEILGDRARLRACQLAARAAAERQFCWELESPRLLETVARALATPISSS